MQLGTWLVLAKQLLILVALLFGHLEGGSPNLVQALVYVGRGLGQAVVEHIVGMGGEAEDVGTLKTQVDQRVDDGSIVELATLAAVGIGMPHLLTQTAVGAVLHKRFPRGHVKREAVHLPIARFEGGIQLSVKAEALHLLGGEVEAVGVGSLEHILCKAEGERGNLLVELAETLLLAGWHVGTSTHKALVLLLQQSHLLAVEAEAVALVVDLLDASKEGRIEGDIVLVLGEQRGNLLGYGIHSVVVLALAEVEEDTAYLLEKGSTILVSLDGVGEGGRFGVVDDAVDFSLLAQHAFLEGGHVVLGLDAGEIGNFVRGAPGGEEGVLHS